MLRTLHGRLALALFGLLLLLGVLHVGSTLLTTHLHEQEVEQSLNRELARNIAAARHGLLLHEDASVRGDGLEELFHWLMVVNPGVEFYLLGPDGAILAYDAEPGQVVRRRVDLAPVRALLAGERALPILGDDPRHRARRKIFSAAPIPPSGPPAGYLYIILDSEEHDSAAGMLRGSYILRLSTLVVAGSLALAGLAGFLLFAHLTRPLRRLAARMAAFRHGHGAIPAPLPRHDEVAVLSAAFDAMVERIRRQMEDLRRMEEQRLELIANVSHDLRTPITGLRGYLETLVLKGEVLPEAEREEYLRIALRQSERLSSMLDELFDLTRLNADRVELRPERFSMAELVQDNVQRYHLRAQEQGVELRAEPHPEAGPAEPVGTLVEADIGLIERALANLLENALRFTPRGGQVSVSLRRKGGRVVVAVADTGPGIPQDELSHIFDRFYRCQFHGEAGQRDTGAGLGLAIARRVVELHAGEIDVESAVGRGTTFSVSLPAAS